MLSAPFVTPIDSLLFFFLLSFTAMLVWIRNLRFNIYLNVSTSFSVNRWQFQLEI